MVDESGDGRTERGSTRSAARAKALRNRANRRHQEQPLSTPGTRVDAEQAERLESQVFHRKPADAGAGEKAALGRDETARQRRRRELKERTRRRGRGRLDLAELEDEA
jgi:hypothetical protein